MELHTTEPLWVWLSRNNKHEFFDYFDGQMINITTFDPASAINLAEEWMATETEDDVEISARIYCETEQNYRFEYHYRDRNTPLEIRYFKVNEVHCFACRFKEKKRMFLDGKGGFLLSP